MPVKWTVFEGTIDVAFHRHITALWFVCPKFFKIVTDIKDRIISGLLQD